MGKISSVYRFTSNHFVTGFGFQIEYESISTGIGACGGSFKTPNGLLTSPSYPNNYRNNEDCTYTISQANGTVIKLNFLSMDTEEIFDELEIRDGSTVNSPLIRKLSGSDIPAPIMSTNNHLWMK